MPHESPEAAMLGRCASIAASLTILALWTGAGPASAQPRPADAGSPITLPYAHEHRLVSEINGREYRILVALPFTYVNEPSDTARHRAMYILDGHTMLPLFARIYRLAQRGAANDVVLVGVGHVGESPWEPPPGGGRHPFRDIDYTPPPMRDSLFYVDHGKPSDLSMFAEDGSRLHGGAPEFLRVLREEVIPLVEQRYRVSSDRGIHGHSLGGLFATYVLFHEPDLFSRYAITSPSLWWDDGALFELVPEFPEVPPQLRRKVYLSIGSEEGPAMTARMWQLASALCWKDGVELTIETVIGEGHSSHVSFSRAMRALYPTDPAGPRLSGAVLECER